MDVILTFDDPTTVPHGAPIACPNCGKAPHGTLEVLYSTADVSIDTAKRTVWFEGYTQTDCLWDSQETVYHNDLPVLVCANGCHFVHADVTEIN